MAIMYRHLLVNIWPLERTNLLLNYGERHHRMSALSFLGVGVQEGTANWGRQLVDGEQILFQNPAASWLPPFSSFWSHVRSTCLATAERREREDRSDDLAFHQARRGGGARPVDHLAAGRSSPASASRCPRATLASRESGSGSPHRRR